MANYCVPTEEQETVIQFDRNGKACHVYTTDTTMMTKLDKIHKCVKHDFADGKPIAAYYEFDKKLLSFRKQRMTGKFSNSDAHMVAAKKNLSKARKSNNS